MLNPSYMDSVISTSESELENELVNVSGQLPSELATQLPTVVVENSSDIHIGPRLQYNGPVTVKQYITVKGKDGSVSPTNTPFDDPVTAHLHPMEVENPVDVVLNTKSKDLLTSQKLRTRYVWCLVAIVLVVATIIALAVALSEAESKSFPPSQINVTDKIHLQYDNEYVDEYEGVKTVQWFVTVSASSQPQFLWYGPNCTVLEENSGPTRHQVYVSQRGSETRLKLHNITVNDSGLYRLQVLTEDDEKWAYFTLNVRGKSPIEKQHVVVCYVAEWAHSRRGLGKFTVENIDPSLCTHLVYAFANLSITRNIIESRSPDYDLEENNGTGAYRKMTSLKKKYPHLKVLLAVGGWAEREAKNYSEVAESSSRRKVFVSSVSEFLRKYNFDGLDLHWQYPAEQHGVKADKENFVALLKDFREEFDKFGWLLTAPLGMLPDTIEHSYDIPAVSKYLDYMFALCYSYHGHWNAQTGPNAPLYPLFPDDDLNVESSINTLLFKGANRNKLVLGLPLYGRIFKLRSTEGPVGFQKPTDGGGMEGEYVQEYGFWGYNEICMKVYNPSENWVKDWDNVTHTPYASKDDQFISYDDVESLKEKVALAVDKKLAGVVVWSLDTDDFRGSCTYGKSGSTTYPLLRAINNALTSWKKVPCKPNVQKGLVN